MYSLPHGLTFSLEAFNLENTITIVHPAADSPLTNRLGSGERRLVKERYTVNTSILPKGTAGLFYLSIL